MEDIKILEEMVNDIINKDDLTLYDKLLKDGGE